MPTPTTQRLVLRKSKDCKHSVVFESTDKDAIIGSLYVKRPFSDSLSVIEVTVTPVTTTHEAAV